MQIGCRHSKQDRVQAMSIRREWLDRTDLNVFCANVEDSVNAALRRAARQMNICVGG
jgi:hypothetical protein